MNGLVVYSSRPYSNVYFLNALTLVTGACEHKSNSFPRQDGRELVRDHNGLTTRRAAPLPSVCLIP